MVEVLFIFLFFWEGGLTSLFYQNTVKNHVFGLQHIFISIRLNSNNVLAFIICTELDSAVSSF